MMTNPLVAQIFDGLSSLQINRICERAGLERMTVNAWIKQRRTPRIDLLTAAANAAGYDVRLTPIQKGNKMTNKPIKIMNRNSGRIEAYISNTLIGYAEYDTLYGIDRKGFASEIGNVNHRTEIPGKLRAWRVSQGMGE